MREKMRSNWTNVMQEAIQAIKEKSFLSRRETKALSVPLSSPQSRFKGNRSNKCSKKRGGQTVFCCEQ